MTIYAHIWFKSKKISFFFFLQESDNRCGDNNWRAANNGGRKSAKLDETGLEIAGQMEYM